ncbi:molybdopterin molybdotransferase MoeA [Comamonas composti]|uniref:molybdopterin molybdotransferase MoeA n=1 Tax=Comamonas composti TaxID=408558 RepID=UPI00041D1897|nr:gephyrin-like molybdotransferase Glp [Comamonas composti]
MTAIFQPASAMAEPQNLSVEQAQAQLASLLTPLGPICETEMLPLAEALDRVLAEDLTSPVDVPPHDNAAMDGYALNGAQLQPGQPLVLQVVGRALAGVPWSGEIGPGQCLKIMTGAVLPAGLDTVVPHELTQALDEQRIRIPADSLRAGANRRLCGEDLGRGNLALPKGQKLHPAALGLLASLGLSQVEVRRRLRVAYFSTGDEILAPGMAAREGAIYDSNSFSLQGLLKRLGVQVLDLGQVPDEPQALETRLREAAALADVVLTSGGISAGEADHTRAMLQRLGHVQFWRLAMRPGKPLAAGLLQPGLSSAFAPKSGTSAIDINVGSSEKQSTQTPRPTVLLGLPGNPVAAMISFALFVRPALLQLMGDTSAPLPLAQAIAAQDFHKRPGRSEYQRGILAMGPDGRARVRSTGAQGSALLSSLVQANCLVVLEPERGQVLAGETVNVLLLDGAI